jgi:hypothetical protein
VKKIGLVVPMIAVLLSLVACATDRPVVLSLDPSPAATSALATSTAGATSPTADASATITREQAVLAAVPAALKSAKQASSETGAKLPDLSQATPKITSYVLIARAGKLSYPFEVREDGQAYELFGYPAKPNPAKLMGDVMPADEAALLQQPSGAREIAAAAAVKAVMEQSPAGGAEIFIYGYNIGFVDAQGRAIASPEGGAFQISVDPSGKLVGL